MARIWPAALLLALAITLLTAGAEDPGDGRLLFGRWSIRTFLAAAVLLGLGVLAIARARSRPLFMKLTVAYVAAGACWCVLELAGLAGWVRYDRLLGGERLSLLGTRPLANVVVSGETREDIATLWGLPSERIAFDYRTNALGFRNRPERGDAELVLLGDSILVAALVPFEDTIAARLERALGRPTMNVALIDQSPADEHQLFRKSGLAPRGRTVVQFLFEGNDLQDMRGDRGPPPATEPSRLERSLTWNAAMLLQRLTQPVAGIARRRVGSLGGEDYAFFWTGQSYQGHEREFAELCAAVGAFAEEVRAGGGRFALAFVPTKLRVLGPITTFPESSELRDLAAQLGPFREHVAAWAKEHGVEFLDLTPALQEAARAGRIPWHRGDTHPNAIGHEAMTAALAEWSFLRP
jgi:hypothetical protein